MIGVVGFMPLFIGAGGTMLPTVVGGGLAFARRQWPWWGRSIAALIAAAPVVFVAADLHDSFGVSLQSVAGFVGLLAIYGAVVSATRFALAPHSAGHRLPRWATVTLLSLLGLVVLHFTAGFVFR